MHNPTTQGFIIFLAGVSFLLLLFISFIVSIVYRYQQKQNAYFKNMEELKQSYERIMLHSQLEIQEQTFQNISKEIHDNIGQKLFLAKLHLHSLSFNENSFIKEKVNDSISLIGDSITDLSDISRSLSSEIVLVNGLLNALEFECSQIERLGLFNIKLLVHGEVIFLDFQKELVLFRIVQEALNNIVKHAAAKIILLKLYFDKKMFRMDIIDDGIGFVLNEGGERGMGLFNMKRRAETLNGKCRINSVPNNGTAIEIEIPLL
jgi:signal transduction histidine kinase